MSKLSNDQGRAYEFAWANVLYDALRGKRKVEIIENSGYEANGRAWEATPSAMQETLHVSAKAAVNALIEMEPLMEENSDDVLLIIPQIDHAGTEGDVRDIVIDRKSITWEIGLSIKHNHDAVKHSRLSRGLDFGNAWYGVPCNSRYWSDVRPIFDMLATEQGKGKKFSELRDKAGDVYRPLLDAFMNEMRRAYAADHSVARRMIEYLIGVTDYYKVISHDSQRATMVYTFNVHGTLGRPSRTRVSVVTVPAVQLPTRIVSLDYKPGSDTTVELYLDNGWQLSFRIHNAEDKIVPSLKFDVQFIGMPVTVLCIKCMWRD